MGYTRRLNQDQYEAKIQDAIKGIQNKEFPSIRSATSHFQVSRSTLSNRLTGMQPRAQAYESRQILSNAEEKTLVRWVTRQTAIRFPVTLALLKETA